MMASEDDDSTKWVDHFLTQANIRMVRPRFEAAGSAEYETIVNLERALHGLRLAVNLRGIDRDGIGGRARQCIAEMAAGAGRFLQTLPGDFGSSEDTLDRERPDAAELLRDEMGGLLGAYWEREDAMDREHARLTGIELARWLVEELAARAPDTGSIGRDLPSDFRGRLDSVGAKFGVMLRGEIDRTDIHGAAEKFIRAGLRILGYPESKARGLFQQLNRRSQESA